MTMLSVWMLPDPGRFGGVGDERMVQSCPATHQMDSMDQKENDSDEIQQIQSMGSMRCSKTCLKMAMLSMWELSDPGLFGGGGNERRVKTCPATHQMDSMDPKENDSDEFQQIQSIGSMGLSKACLKTVSYTHLTLPTTSRV